MKILIVVPSYIPAYRYGGPIGSVHALAKELVIAGHRVVVFTTDADGPGSLSVPTNVAVDVDGVEVWYFPRSFPRAWCYSVAMHRALRERTKEFDVVYAVSVFLAASTLAARAAHRAGVPYVISPRGSLMTEPLRRKSRWKKWWYLRLVEWKNLSRAAAVHFTTAMERNEYIAAGLPLPQAIIVPNAVVPAPEAAGIVPGAFRKRHGIPMEAPVVLFMSRINWKKGLDTLIPAFRRVADAVPDARLVIAGGDDDGYRSTVEEWVRAAGLSDRVIFPGLISGAEKQAVLRDSTLFVLPSYAENFGMAVLEALAAGIPAVVTPGVALAEDVARAGAGAVAAKDPEAFGAAIIRFLKDPQMCRAAGEAGRKAVTAHYASPAVATAMAGELAALRRR